MSGMTSGISTGAVRTWKPFGGGGAATTSGGGGGGGSSFGGGGSSLGVSTKSIFSCRGFSFWIAALAVAYTARPTRIECRTMLAIVPPPRFSFFGLDSSRLLNIQSPERWTRLPEVTVRDSSRETYRRNGEKIKKR